MVFALNNLFYLFALSIVPKFPQMQKSGPLSTHIAQIAHRIPAFPSLYCQLYRLGQNEVSQPHQQSCIIINPKAISDFFQNAQLSELRSRDLASHIQVKRHIYNLILALIQEFSLNAKFIYQSSSFLSEGSHNNSFLNYLLEDIASLFEMKDSLRHCDLHHIVDQILKTCSRLFYQICNVCTLRTSELKRITNRLADCYYREKLKVDMIGFYFRILDAGFQQRNITPYIYFTANTRNDSIKILFSNNRWHFSKGMTLLLWVSQLKATDCTLFHMRTDDRSQIHIRLVENKLVIECIQVCAQEGHKEKRHKEVIEGVSVSINSPTPIGIQLLPKSAGLFSASTLALNIKINNQQFMDICKNMPSFSKSEFIVEYSLLSHFIGKVYSIIITACSDLEQWEQIKKVSQYGICKETLVWEFIDLEIIKRESILCIFNSERTFEGLLLNYVSEKNHACFEGKVSEVKYHKYDSKIVDIYLPFLHLLSLAKEKDAEWLQLFDLIIQHILQLIGRQNYEIDSILLILYFLQVNSYSISQSTLNCLYYHHKDTDNFYLNLVVKYLDVHQLIQKGLKIDDSLEPYESPVEKIILLFFLETLWKQKWNIFQGFEGWWSPSFFSSQNDKPFDARDFLFSKERESRVEWSVINLITRDHCKCFIEPVFIVPSYSNSNRYQQQYVKKECFNQEFRLNLTKIKISNKIVCQKAANSNLDRLKSKLFGKNDLSTLSPFRKSKNQLKQFESQCIHIDILTIIQGIIRVSKEGTIIFTASHRNKKFDHLCTKGFQNESFYYINIQASEIGKVYEKRYNATNNSVNILMKDGREIMFYFYHNNAQSFLSSIENGAKIKEDPFSNYVKSSQPLRWIDKSISNYEYLQWLNEIAGRSYNDITQYPFLPWIYKADKEDDPKPYRDLTKNMGCNGDEQRIQHFISKYQENKEELFNQYFFGTHYSSSPILFNFLIRIRPYSIGAITMQSGQFDCADRIFYSYCGSWINATTSPTDLRELIPEIYTLPEMYINKNNYDYGKTQEKVVVDNVILPQWSQQNPYIFVSKIRKEMESAYVTDNISSWIDLIYGYKQRGKDAVQSMNIFYPLTYENCIDLSLVTEPDERQSFQTQIAHFGQNPSQIIGSNPHPLRRAMKAAWEQKLLADGGEFVIQKCHLEQASLKQQKFLFKSVFQGRNSILSIKFVSHDLFFVLRKHQYHLIKILNKKGQFLQKDLSSSYEIQSCTVSLNYKELPSFIPIIVINNQIVIVGGFYNGYVQIIFLKEEKYNRSFRFLSTTITALNFEKAYSMLYVGDSQGYFRTYRLHLSSKAVEFEQLKVIKAHDTKINEITNNLKANLCCTCSADGTLNLYNLYSHNIIRAIHHPQYLPIQFAYISTNPLYSLVFYSKQDCSFYVYSINGQFLQKLEEKTGMVYNMTILKATDFSESLVYLNGYREISVLELPFLKSKKRVRVKRDQWRVSCFEACPSGRMAIIGTEDGALQIVANPTAYS